MEKVILFTSGVLQFTVCVLR